MPLYEYECQQCHRRTEKIQKFSDPELTVCPFCGGALERTLTAPAIQFKGAGWYKDLYSSAKPAPAGGGEGRSATGGGEDKGAPAAKSDAATPSGETGAATAPSSGTAPASSSGSGTSGSGI